MDPIMKPHSSSKAFSLIELLIVISVIGILLAIAAPNVFSLLNAHTLTGEGTLLRNKLTLAQQKALSGNADVEFRFFKMADLENAESESQYRSFQLFMHNSVGEMEPITELLRIKPPVYINERMSTLIEGGTASGKYEVTEGGKKVEREYKGFRFKPDGSTDLGGRSSAGDTWYVVLVQGTENLGGTLPNNYFVVQLDPYNGRVSEYRP